MSVMVSSSSIMGDKNSVLAMNDDILWQIVVRLPTKSLMRFKCVSKHWYKIIRDPSFVKSYIGGFHGLLIAHQTNAYFRNKHWHRLVGVASSSFPFPNCFLIDSDNDNIKRNSNIPVCYQLWLKDKNMHDHYSVTNIEKGLCVFYNYNSGAFTLCNIATHELLDLPIKSPKEQRLQCYLGFEPVRGVYKLLRFCSDKYERYLRIGTLGGEEDKDLDWRSIGEATKIICFRRNICVNGILYLTPWPLRHNKLLVAFDLSTVTAPQCIPLPDSFTEGGELIQLGGSPGLIHLTHEMSTIWILKYDKTWAKSQCVDLTRICDFTKSVSVGFRGICGFYITYVGTLPTGEMLLARNLCRDKSIISIYKYDHIQNKLLNWTELCIPSYSWTGEYCWICYHEDNIVPLHSLITRCSIRGSYCN